MMKRGHILRASAWAYRTAFLLLPASVFASAENPNPLNTLLKQAGGQIKTGGEGTGGNLPELIGRLINAALSVLGLVFLVLVVYAGYLWMTANGEKTKTEKAKTLLGQAIIGIVIIVGAYAISAFVIGRLSTAVLPSGQAVPEVRSSLDKPTLNKHLTHFL